MLKAPIGAQVSAQAPTLKAPSRPIPNLLGTSSGARAEFYDEFLHEAAQHDRRFVKDHKENLNFVVYTVTLISIYIGVFIAIVHPTLKDPVPNPIISHIRMFLNLGFAIFALAVFVALLGWQWLDQYARVERRVSVIDCARDRQRKMNELTTWNFDLIMRTPELALQVGFYFHYYAAMRYLCAKDKTLANGLIVVNGVGLILYFLASLIAILRDDFLFPTPLFYILRFLIRFKNDPKEHINRFRKLFGHIFGKTESDGFVLDSNMITWMIRLGKPMHTVVARFIPLVVWHARIRSDPLEWLYDRMLGCFDHSTGYTIINPDLSDKAYLCAKAFLHLAIQRKCIRDGPSEVTFQSISRRHPVMGSNRCEGVSADLEVTLGIICRVLGGTVAIDWQSFSFSIPHHAWMSHIFVYRACAAIDNGGSLPDDIEGFIRYSFQLEPLPPMPIVADCLLMVGLVLGIGLRDSDVLMVVNKSYEIELQIDQIIGKLTNVFEKPTHATNEVVRALAAVGHTGDIQRAILAVLRGMADSRRWSPHVVQEKRELLGYLKTRFAM